MPQIEPFYSEVHYRGGHSKLVNTADYQIIPLEANGKYQYDPDPRSASACSTVLHLADGGISNFSPYPQPCLYKDGKDRLHFPERDGAFHGCDENSMLIDDSLTPEDGSAVSFHPASSKRLLKDNLWNRSFCGHQGGRTYAEKFVWKIAASVNDRYKALKSFTQSFFNKSRKTQSKRRSGTASYASGTSTSSTDTSEQVRSDWFNMDGYTDGDGPAHGGWLGRRKKSGSRLEHASGQTSYRT